MQKRRTRMYEPWGYREENNYQSSENIREDDLSSFFADVEYKRSDNKIHFSNKDGEEVGTLNVNDFIKSDQIVEKAWYEDGKIYVKFTNGDLITVDVKELLDENEFKEGLQVVDGVVSVLRDPSSERWLTVSLDGVKVSGIQAEIDRLDERIDNEISRATSEESRIEAKLDAEITRSTNEDTRLDGKIDDETTRAKEAEAGLSRRIDTLNDELDAEKSIRESKDLEEKNRATSEEARIEAKIDSEAARATSAETTLNDTKANKNEAIASASYDESAKTIYFYDISDNVLSSIDATPFITDGMIDDVKIEDGKLIIVFNTDAGKETIEIPLSDIFNPDNYYTKDEIDEKVSTINDNISDEVSARESGDTALEDKITALEDVAATKVELEAEASRAVSAETDLQEAIDLKADKETTYTQEEVDSLIKAKETEIYNLTKLVGEIGGNVTYNYPNELGTSLTSLLGNYGTVKLGEDATITRYGPGITAKNKVTLNLNNHNLTSTAASSYGAIMARGTQEITIGGKGTIDAGDGICIEANGTSSLEPLATINLTGSTTTYRTNRPGGELIYCYVGIINITNGTFRNDGASEYTLNCYDANYHAGTAKIIVTGGKFYDFNPADNNAEGEHTSFVPEGYHVETSTVTEDGVEHTIYTVKKDA